MHRTKRFKDARGYHVAVADRLDLLQTVFLDERVEALEEANKFLRQPKQFRAARAGCQTTDPLTAFIKASCLLHQLLY